MIGVGVFVGCTGHFSAKGLFFVLCRISRLYSIDTRFQSLDRLAEIGNLRFKLCDEVGLFFFLFCRFFRMFLFCFFFGFFFSFFFGFFSGFFIGFSGFRLFFCGAFFLCLFGAFFRFFRFFYRLGRFFAVIIKQSVQGGLLFFGQPFQIFRNHFRGQFPVKKSHNLSYSFILR